MASHKYLRFRCTGCGNCCKEPLLPLTHVDLLRIVRHTGRAPDTIVRFVDRHAIDLDGEPESFVQLRQGKRVMVLRHDRSGCVFLNRENRCTIYAERPLGCRIFPFDPTFAKSGKLRHLKLIQATECLYELDGKNHVGRLRSLHAGYERAASDYQAKVADWNQTQRRRLRQGKRPRLARDFLAFLQEV